MSKQNKKKVKIVIKPWHYKCGDGCCDMYGDTLTVNGKVCDNEYAGDGVVEALEFTLAELGFELELIVEGYD